MLTPAKRRILVVLAALVVLAVCGRLVFIAYTIGRMENLTMGASIGPDKSRNVLVEFMDYRCKYCRTINAEIMEFAQRHPDVKIVFRHFPIYALPSVREAQIALAAAKQGKFLPVHEYLISRETAVDEAEIPGIAQQFGLDADRLKKDMHAGDIGRHMLETVDGGHRLGIRSTPSFLINGRLYAPHNGIPDINGFDALYAQYRRGP